MPLPIPHPGLVISYAHLWAREHGEGREDGVKHRPCAVVLARSVVNENVLVRVAAITHSKPVDAAIAVEIPPAAKKLVGLDGLPSWIVISEVNDFIWPGPDLATVPRSGGVRYDYGVLPPGFFRVVREQLLKLLAERRIVQVPRSE